MKKRFYCDLETSGLNPSIHGIIQVAGIVEIEGNVVDSIDLDGRLFPEDRAEAQALEVAGYTQDEVFNGEQRLLPREVHSRLKTFLGTYVNPYEPKDKFQFVGYNSLSFDSNFLRKFFQKCGDQYYGSWFWHPSLDVMAMAAYACEMERAQMSKKFTLANVCRYFNIPWDEDKAHDALYDVEQTRTLCLAVERKLQSAQR